MYWYVYTLEGDTTFSLPSLRRKGWGRFSLRYLFAEALFIRGTKVGCIDEHPTNSPVASQYNTFRSLMINALHKHNPQPSRCLSSWMDAEFIQVDSTKTKLANGITSASPNGSPMATSYRLTRMIYPLSSCDQFFDNW